MCVASKRSLSGWFAWSRGYPVHSYVAKVIGSRGWKGPAPLVDQGTSDQFLQSQLKPELLEEACRRAGVSLDLRLQEDCDQNYLRSAPEALAVCVAMKSIRGGDRQS